LSRLKSEKSQVHALHTQIFSAATLALAAVILLMVLVATGHADMTDASIHDHIFIEKISTGVNANGGYGYKLQYYVAAPIDVFWPFKINFDSEILTTNNELIEHRLVRVEDNRVVTENRYAIAPGLIFLWQTTVIEEKYRLEFKLLNAEDCRHDYHYGVIQLSPAGTYTKVTQTAFFNFVGASMWVRYPWYGGMKSTLTNVAEWEQKMALRQRFNNKVVDKDPIENKKRGIHFKEPQR